jgi:hypothetical protein
MTLRLIASRQSCPHERMRLKPARLPVWFKLSSAVICARCGKRHMDISRPGVFVFLDSIGGPKVAEFAREVERLGTAPSGSSR